MVLKEASTNNSNPIYPGFKLLSTDNSIKTHNELMGEKGLVVIFTCNHCPYAKALWDRLIEDVATINSMGFNVVTINPNINPDYPDDSFENMVKFANSVNLPFHYLVDETQEVASQYDAQCTPDLFVLNPKMELIYRGAYDDNWKDHEKVEKTYLLNALNQYVNEPSSTIEVEKLSMGCSIKWVKNAS